MNNTNQKPRKNKGLGAGIIAFGVVFALFSVIFHPHTLGGYILAFVFSGLLAAVVKVMGEGLDLSVKEKPIESLNKIATDTGNPEVDALLAKGREMIGQLHAENKLIHEPSLNATLDQLEQQSSEVFRVVYEKPAKAGQIRKFMDYYLPTTLKLVSGYRMLGERKITGSDAANARKRIDEALGVVLKGCHKMLDNLYRDDVLDLTTDIDVLEQMLKRDGLTESALAQAAAQAREAAQIDRMVNEAPKNADPLQWQPGKQTDTAQKVQAAVQQAEAHHPQAPMMRQGGGES